MNFNLNNIFGIVIGWFMAAWGYLTSSAQWTVDAMPDWTINQWAALGGLIGVFGNLYFAWARHHREVIKYEYEVGLREERRSRPIREEDVK